MWEPYELSCELRGHDEDVRGVAVCPLGILTASRDKTVKLWAEEKGADGHPGYTLTQTMVGHTDFVGPVVYIGPGASTDYPQGAVVSGSRDKTVRVWDPSSASCLATLEGHQYQVTALGLLPPTAPGGAGIVSGALDKTLRVWRGGKCCAVLSGHEGPVLCLLCLPGGEVLSGSGDTTVRMWAEGADGTWSCIHTIKAHGDTVRGICAVPGLGFATASHDMTCRVWDSTGGLLAELVGHSAIVYCVAAVDVAGEGAGEAGGVVLASGSEDNTVRLWRPSGECMQVIEHPGNIWAVDFASPSGDLVTGCSDAVARTWSHSVERRGPPELAEALAAVLAERKAAKEAAAAGGGGDAGGAGGGGGGGLPPGLKVEEPFALSQPGSKAGENKFVRDGATGDVVAYSWDAAAFQWEKIGVVVEGPGQGGGGGGGGGGGRVKKLHAGREWDFVFDVDIGENMPTKKLALNEDENPYLVAQRFIEQEELPPYFQEQIVQFIMQNTSGAKGAAPAPTGDVTGGFCDPFTGGSGGPRASAGGPAGGARQPVPAAPFSVTGGGVDPFTGGGGGGSAPAGRPGHASVHVPCHTFLTFDNVPNMEALGRKVREFNAGLAAEAQLSEAELAPGGAFESLLAKLPAVAAAAAKASSAGGGGAASTSSAPSSGGLAPGDVALLRRLLSWPADRLFPCLDIARLAVLDPQAAALLAAPEAAGDLSAAEPAAGTLAGALSAACSSPLPANHQLALRLAANCCAAPTSSTSSGASTPGVSALRGWLLGGASALLDRAAPLLGPGAPGGGTKAVRLSGAVLLGNLAAAAGRGQLPGGAYSDLPVQLLSLCLELLSALPAGAVLDEAEGGFRALVAAGTLLAAGGADLAQIARDLDINDRIHSVVSGARGGGEAEKKLLQAGIDVSAIIAQKTGVKV